MPLNLNQSWLVDAVPLHHTTTDTVRTLAHFCFVTVSEMKLNTTQSG